MNGNFMPVGIDLSFVLFRLLFLLLPQPFHPLPELVFQFFRQDATQGTKKGLYSLFCIAEDRDLFGIEPGKLVRIGVKMNDLCSPGDSRLFGITEVYKDLTPDPENEVGLL